MFTAMPSPNGTNYENLFLHTRRPVAAYDSTEGLAHELTNERVLQFLSEKVSSDLVAKIRDALADPFAADSRRHGARSGFDQRYPQASRIKLPAW